MLLSSFSSVSLRLPRTVLHLVGLTLCASILFVGCDSGGNGGGPDDFRGVEVESRVSTSDNVDGELEDSDASLSDVDSRFSGESNRADLYELQIDDDGTEVEIGMTSNPIDPELYLFERDGDFVGNNDDGGAGFNSLLNLTLESGNYIIVASSFGDDDRGPYELSIQ